MNEFKLPRIFKWQLWPRWREKISEQSCDLPPVILTASGFTSTPIPSGCYVFATFNCPVAGIQVLSISPSLPAGSSLIDFYDYLSLNYGWLGTWNLTGDVVTLELKGNIAKEMCPNETVAFIAGQVCPA